MAFTHRHTPLARPAAFNDSVALKTQWVHEPPGVAGNWWYTLVEKSPQRLEFRLTLGSLLIILVIVGFSLACFGFLGFWAFMIMKIMWEGAGSGMGSLSSDVFWLVNLLCGELFFGIALYQIGVKSRRPIVFDRQSGWFWIGWRQPDAADKWAFPLKDIHALQIIEYYSGDESSTYLSQQLNLVLRDARRIWVSSNTDVEVLRDDARRLSQMLGCKVWDATGQLPVP